jgi:hypothetical protein
MRHLVFLALAALAVDSARGQQCGQWSTRHAVGLDPIVRALEIVDLGSGPELWAGGDFQVSGGSPAVAVARWTGSSWVGVGSFPGRGVLDLTVFDPGTGPRVYASADVYAAPDGMYEWDGASWTLLVDDVEATAVFDDGGGPALFAGGRSMSIVGSSQYFRGLARWNGNSWKGFNLLLGSNLTPQLVWDDGSGPALFLTGVAYPGGPSGKGVYRCDGTSVQRYGDEFDDDVLDLAVHEGVLFACGAFSSVGGTPTTDVVRWNGTKWAGVPPSGAGGGIVTAIESHDAGDGSGPALYAGGTFTVMGGVSAKRIARWDGQGWEALGLGFTKKVEDLLSFADGSGTWPTLWAAGWFPSAGGVPSLHVAEWENPCACEGSSYCTAGGTANGCTALVSSTGNASRSAASDFDIAVTGSEGGGPGVVFFGTNGEQGKAWGNGTSYRCVVPPLVRTGLDQGAGTPGQCDGAFQLDFNAWMAANPQKAPPGGATAYLQCWFRDPQNTSNQVTSFSDALRFAVCP